MSYEEDRAEAVLWEKIRIGSMLIAIILLVLSAATKIDWLHWPRAAAWIFAGYAAFREGRAWKRLGRDPDSIYLRAVLFALVGVYCIFRP